MKQHIAKYELLQQIGEGGFGKVFKARDPFIKRLVAIKTCNLESDELRKRFFREAQVAGRFDHPNVTIVHDFGVEEEQAYLVQEYLSGEDLSDIIARREVVPLRRKIEILAQAARGLAYAHSQGVIHRDIKPGNIRVLDSGQVKIMDFGIAKVASSSTRLTQQGMAVGTVGYLSPEQLGGGEIDERTDVFAFGITAYEFLANHLPFEGGDLSEVLRAIMDGRFTPLGKIVPNCPFELEMVIEQCLEKDHDSRQESFDSIADQFEAMLATIPDADGANGPKDGPPAEKTVLLPLDELMDEEEQEAFGDAAPTVIEEVPWSLPLDADEPTEARDDRTSPRRDTQPFKVPVAPAPAAAPPEELPGGPSTTAKVPEEAPEISDEAHQKPLRGRDLIAAAVREEDAEAPGHPESTAEILSTPPPADALAGTDGIEGERASVTAPIAAAAAPAAFPVSSASESAPAVAARAPADRSAKGAASPRSPIVILSGVVLLSVVGVGAIGWWWAQREPATPAPDPPPVVEPEPVVVEPVSIPVTPTHRVRVSAEPWGEILSILDGAGNEMEVPREGVTPLALDLPEGLYSVILSHPDAAEPQICQVTIQEGSVASCHVTFETVDVTDYFRQTGWWQ